MSNQLPTSTNNIMNKQHEANMPDLDVLVGGYLFQGYRWMTMHGVARVLGTRHHRLSLDELKYFNHQLFNKNDIDPGLIPEAFDQDPNLLKEKMPNYFQDFTRRMWAQHVNNFPDLSNPDAARSVYSVTDLSSNGHSILSISFQNNPKAQELVSDPTALLHSLSGFPGGGALASSGDLVTAIVNGRRYKRFPFETFDELYPSMQQRMIDEIKSGELLEGQVGLLAGNAIYFKQHEVIPLTPEGMGIQLLRPQTLLPHVVDGQGIWVAINHPSLPDDVVAYSFIGHGKNPTLIAELANNTFAPSVWGLSFRTGNTSYANFDRYKDELGEEAYMLGMSGNYKSALSSDLIAEDFNYRYNIGLLATMDMILGNPVRWSREYFGPNTCPVPPEVKEALLAISEPLEECDTTEVDIDKLGEEIDAGTITDAAGIDAFIDASPIVHTRAGVYQADGTLYPGDAASAMMCTPKDTPSTFELSPDSLLGGPIDEMIADAVKKNLKDVDWQSIESELMGKIKDGVGEIVSAFDPFKGGSSVDALASEYAANTDFMDSIRSGLNNILNETLGPKLDEIKNIAAENPATKDLELTDYPFIESLTSQVWNATTAGNAESPSYIELRIKAELARQKVHYISEPENKAAIQQDIADKLNELGDLSTLDKDISQTNAEYEKSQKALKEVTEKLILNPDDTDLQKQAEDLQRDIAKEIDELDELNKKKAEADEIAREQSNLDTDSLDKESSRAERDADKHGKDIFEV